MKIVFDTCIINFIVDGERINEINAILSYKNRGVDILVQYSIIREIEDTPDESRKALLKEQVKNFKIIEEHLSILPFHFPVTLCTEEDSLVYENLAKMTDKDKKDARVLLDSMRSAKADIFVTEDKKLIKNKERIKQLGFTVMTLKESYEYMENKEYVPEIKT